jgi:uncharacterized membrane protein
VLFAKHAQHVVFVHFPVALFLTGVACDTVSRWASREKLATVARFNLIAAAFTAIPTALTGALAWQWQLEGQKLKGALFLHVALAITATVVMCIVAWLRLKKQKDAKHVSAYILSLEYLGMTLIMLTAHLGGYVSGVNAS